MGADGVQSRVGYEHSGTKPGLLSSHASVRTVASYNILCLICPSAAAFCAFILCRYVCGRFWPALLGGYVFGFSPYVLSQMLGHMVEMFIFPVPLMGYLMLLRMDKQVSQYGFVTFLVIPYSFTS